MYETVDIVKDIKQPQLQMRIELINVSRRQTIMV